jgi:hypothetical protein
LLFAEVVIFVFATSPHLLLEGTFQILYVYLDLMSAPAEGVGDFDLFYVVDAEQVGDGVHYSFLEVVDYLFYLVLLRKTERFDHYLNVACVSVGVELDLPEHLVQSLLDQLEVAMEHLCKFDGLQFQGLIYIISHPYILIIFDRFKSEL